MENKALFAIDTSWSFPIVKYSSNVSYIEVRKASGIAFILLELISHTDSSNERISSAISYLGVPTDIQHIFADEISNMLFYKIIEMKSGRDYYVESFDIYNISDFQITELGKKLFAEGTIPTGSTSSRRIELFFDVSQKETSTNFTGKIYRLESSSLNQSCISDVILNDSDVEAYINENMKMLGFKKGEVITNYVHNNNEYWTYKEEGAVNVSFDAERMYLSAQNKTKDKYIKQFYSAQVISNMLKMKNKFRFSDMTDAISVYDYSSIDKINKIILPAQFDQILSKNYQIGLCRSKVMKNSICSLNCSDASKLMDVCGIEGNACYFENGKLYSVLAGNFFVPLDGYSEKCEVSLIVIIDADDSVQQQMIDKLFLRCMNTDDTAESVKWLKALTIITNESRYIEEYADVCINKQINTEKSVLAFLDLNNHFKGIKGWTDIAKNIAANLFDQLCTQINTYNFSVKENLCNELNSILNYKKIEYLQKISKTLLDTESSDVVYDILCNAGFAESEILGIVNIFKINCKAVLYDGEIIGHSKMSSHFSIISKTLFNLKQLSGIFNVYEDAANTDIDAERFIKAYSAFASNFDKIEQYKLFASDEYEALKAFKDRFTELNDFISIESAAIQNPEKINRNYIGQLLKKSRYKDAICDLHIRMQYELNRIYRTSNAGTHELLSKGNITDYLEKEDVNKLHLLRKCRNEYQHPTGKRSINYSSETIIEWCSIIEKLGDVTDESRSED